MVKVIKVGKKQVTCSNCESLLEYTQNEVTQHEVNHDYIGDFDTIQGIICPVYNNIIRIR